MTNDPKDAVVDMSKLLRAHNSASASTQTIPVKNTKPAIPVENTAAMITKCTEAVVDGAGLIGCELSTLTEKPSRLIGHETFTRKDKVEDKKSD